MKSVPEIYWNLPYLCHKCGQRFENISKHQKHYRKYHNYNLSQFEYKGKMIKMDKPIKKGVCQISFCNSVNHTQIHHIVYHDDDMLKDTIELCEDCHGAQQNIPKGTLAVYIRPNLIINM